MSGFCAPFSSQCVDTARGCKSPNYAPYPVYCCMTFTTVDACSLLRRTGLVDPQLLVVTCGPRPRQCSCSARDAKQVRRPAVMNCPRRQGGGCPSQRGGDGRAAPLWTLEARRLERTDVAHQHVRAKTYAQRSAAMHAATFFLAIRGGDALRDAAGPLGPCDTGHRLLIIRKRGGPSGGRLSSFPVE